MVQGIPLRKPEDRQGLTSQNEKIRETQIQKCWQNHQGILPFQ